MNTTKYALVQIVLAQSPELEITKIEYQNIVTARTNLTDCTAIEEKFDIALENYCELENEITKVAARDMMFFDTNTVSLWNMGNLLNRRINNFLSSSRAYLDHTDHHLSNVFGKDSEYSFKYKQLRKKQYDSVYAYRIVEAMRNYGQHRGLPLHNWLLGARKVGDLSDPAYEFRLGLRIRADKLREDGKFKAKALEDIDGLGGSADLLLILRMYIESLSEIHSNIRELIADRVAGIESVLQDAITRYSVLCESPKDVVGLAAAALDRDGDLIKQTYLVPEAIDFRRNFVIKNHRLFNFSKRFVTSRVARKDEDK